MQTALQVQEKKEQANPIFVEAENLIKQMRSFSQTIANRAYEFFEARGREWGHELEDWIRAELELTRSVPVEITSTDTNVNIRVEVPVFTEKEIKVSVEPWRVLLSGKSDRPNVSESAETVHSEFRRNEFCRQLTLPSEVVPGQASAVLKDGVLELKLTKAAAMTGVRVEVKTS